LLWFEQVLEKHLSKGDLDRPFPEAEMETLLNHEAPPKYQRVRRMIFHKSAADKAHLFQVGGSSTPGSAGSTTGVAQESLCGVVAAG
jgi:hypothetical protein